MIYAIKALGTNFVKIGVTRDAKVGRRLADHQVSNPFELELIGVADWPDTAERQLHHYLADLRERGEWFREGERLSHALRLMADRENGLAAFLAIAIPPKKQRKKPVKRVLGRIGPKLGTKVSL